MERWREASRCQMVTRCELKRTERPTPQIWSPVEEGGVSGGWKVKAGVKKGGERTLLEHALQLLPDGQQLHARPHVGPVALGHAEGPAAAEHVAAVLPDGLEAGLEQVDALAHLDLVDGGVVVVAPKVLHALDAGAELLELRLVLAAALLLLLLLGRLAVEPHVPVVLGRERAHGLEEVALGVVALLGGRRHAGRVGVGALRQPREAAREEGRAHCHGGWLWDRSGWSR